MTQSTICAQHSRNGSHNVWTRYWICQYIFNANQIFFCLWNAEERKNGVKHKVNASRNSENLWWLQFNIWKWIRRLNAVKFCKQHQKTRNITWSYICIFFPMLCSILFPFIRIMRNGCLFYMCNKCTCVRIDWLTH